MHAGATCLEVYTRYMIRPRNSILSRGIVYARESMAAVVFQNRIYHDEVTSLNPSSLECVGPFFHGAELHPAAAVITHATRIPSHI